MPEGRGLVPFDHEVSEPGKAVGDQRPCQRPPTVTGRDHCDDERDADTRAARVQQPVGTVAVLRQVIDEEIVVAVEVTGLAIGHERYGV